MNQCSNPVKLAKARAVLYTTNQMGPLLTALIFGAGAATFVYSKSGRRIGYGNGRSVWTLVGVTFVLVFIAVLVLLSTLVHLNN